MNLDIKKTNPTPLEGHDMNKIQTWRYKNRWRACRIFPDDQKIMRYTVSVYGTGKTKPKAINSLCEALMTLSDDMCEVVHQVNING